MTLTSPGTMVSLTSPDWMTCPTCIICPACNRACCCSCCCCSCCSCRPETCGHHSKCFLMHFPEHLIFEICTTTQQFNGSVIANPFPRSILALGNLKYLGGFGKHYENASSDCLTGIPALSSSAFPSPPSATAGDGSSFCGDPGRPRRATGSRSTGRRTAGRPCGCACAP